MSDDESFVILGSSPNSVQNFSSLNKDSSLSLKKDVTDSGSGNVISHQSDGKLIDQVNSDISLDFKYSFMADNKSIEQPVLPEVNLARRLKRDSFTTSEILDITNGCDSIQSNSPKATLNGISFMSKSSMFGSGSSMIKPSARQGTLASNFLMGDIDLDELKDKVYSEFPSLCGSHANNEDILRLQNFMSQYVELKETLKRNNIAMRQHFSIIQKWQDDIKMYKEEQKQQQIKFEEIIAKLNIDNMQIRQELESKIEHFQFNEISMRQDNKELNMKISEQSAQIENMAIQIQKLEKQNLATFEYVEKKGINDEKEKNLEFEYVSNLEHKRVTKNFERQLSEITAQKLELEEMKQVYVDEINCLKVNLTAAEELINKTQTDINILKGKDNERTEFVEKYEKERNEMSQTMELLKRQVEIYNNDFQIERTDRQNLADEKEQILSELKLLQQRNQQLVEEQQVRNNERSSPSGAIRKTPEKSTTPSQHKHGHGNLSRPPVIHECPLCSRLFDNLDLLQMHVQDCIDQ